MVQSLRSAGNHRPSGPQNLLIDTPERKLGCSSEHRRDANCLRLLEGHSIPPEKSSSQSNNKR